MKKTMISIRSSILLIILMAMALVSCDETSQDAGTEKLEFAMEPTENLSFMINETPSDFTWEFFSDNLTVHLESNPTWNGDIVFSSLQVERGDVINRSSTPPVSVSSEELSGGLSSGELFPGLVYIPGQEWVMNKQWLHADQWPQAKQWISLEEASPVEEWNTETKWKPAEIESAILSEIDLEENQTLLVVYARSAPDSQERDQLTQPYGIIFDTDLGGPF